ncbi:MAG: EAL domain-containing protein [Pseudomonadota bacterium]
MLLIVGTHTDRLADIHKVASASSLALRVADNHVAMKDALSGSRRRIVVLQQEDLTARMRETLAEFDGDPNVAVLLVAAEASAEEPLDGLEAQWLSPGVSGAELAERIRSSRAAMFRVTEAALRTAFERREFVVQYQPKVEWHEAERAWRTADVEALVRWQHPQHGLLPPRHFLPDIENYGLMTDLAEYVLERTCEQLVAWHEQSLLLNGSVNLSPSCLDDDDLVERMSAVLARFDLPSGRIMFELPSAGILAERQRRGGAVQALRAAGFRVSLDDFGIAASCMEAFEVIEFDELKLHASVLRDGRDDDGLRQSLAALAGLAANLGIAVCAEGVETEETFRFLTEIRCNRMQGYLVSAAVMPEIIQSCYAQGHEPGVALAHMM